IHIVFFFSSRRRHTRWPRDWSSDVCSSDLTPGHPAAGGDAEGGGGPPRGLVGPRLTAADDLLKHGGRSRQAASRRSDRPYLNPRSEERRVGKEWRSRWGRHHEKKKERDERE